LYLHEKVNLPTKIHQILEAEHVSAEMLLSTI
jgi:hypothetical protein